MDTNFFFSTLGSLLFLVIFIQIVTRKAKNQRKLPPGNMGLIPWVGETLDFYKAYQKNQLFESFIQPRTEKHGKIFKTKLLGYPTVVVNGADANHFFLSNEFKLVVSSWPSSLLALLGKNSVMEKQGEAHKRVRGVMATSLGSGGMESMVPKICNSIRSHLDQHWVGKDEVSLYQTNKIMISAIACQCLLGIEVDQKILGLFGTILAGVLAPPINCFGTKYSRAKKARDEIAKIFGKIVRERKEMMMVDPSVKREGEEFLLSRMVGKIIEGEMTEEEVVDNVVLLVFAGDTSSSVLVSIFRMLAGQPHCYSLLVQENLAILENKGAGENLTLKDTLNMKYTWQVARECMRLFPPVFGSFKKASVDIEYDGFLIPKGWKILWTAYGTHYSEDYFKNPQSFDPTRFEEIIQPYVFLPFGGGPRTCAGYQMAKLNILIFIHYVVTHFNWSLKFPDETTYGPTAIPSHGMPLKISPKN